MINAMNAYFLQTSTFSALFCLNSDVRLLLVDVLSYRLSVMLVWLRCSLIFKPSNFLYKYFSLSHPQIPIDITFKHNSW